MSFKDFLIETVDKARMDAKNKAIEMIINILKSDMTDTAERGLSSERIYYDDGMIDNINRLDIHILKNILKEENRYDLIGWLIDKVIETNVFDGITIEHSDEDVDESSGWYKYSW